MTTAAGFSHIRRQTPRASELRHGFSLLEMLIVLAIMAALSLVAVQSLEPVAEQARYEATKRSLEEIKSAIVAVNQSGGTSYASGFAADLSFVPPLTSATDFHSALTYGTGLPEPATYAAGGMTAVYGWRGPYLQSQITSTMFVDGWGRPFGAEVQDVGGVPKATFNSLTDRIVISNANVATKSSQVASTIITGAMLSATQLTVNLYGLDVNGNRITLTGEGAPITSLPEVFLLGGNNMTDGLMTTLTGSVSAVGTVCNCQFTPTFPQLLIGTRTLSVVTPSSTTANYQTYSPTTQINLVPGTSPVVEVLVVRQTSVVVEP